MLADRSYWYSATAGLALALAMTFHASPSQAGKPETLPEVTLTFIGEDVDGTKESFEVKRSSKRGQVLVEIVVREMLLSVPAAIDEFDSGEVCFQGNATAAGMLSLYSDDTADFDLFATFFTNEGELQSYNFFLEGTHNVALGADTVAGTGNVDFTTMDVDTEGRGKKPKSCRGTISDLDTMLLID